MKRGTGTEREDLKEPAVGDWEVKEAHVPLSFVNEVGGRGRGWNKVCISCGQTERPVDPSKLVCTVGGDEHRLATRSSIHVGLRS